MGTCDSQVREAQEAEALSRSLSRADNQNVSQATLS